MKTNPAARVLNLLQSLIEKAPSENSAMAENWFAILDVKQSDHNTRLIELTDKFRLIFHQIDLIKNQMHFSESDEFDCLSILDALNNIFQISQFDKPWKFTKPLITRELLLCLGYCRELIPDDDQLIDAGELAEIYAELDSLQLAISSSSLPSHSKEIIMNFINRMRQVLSSYKITGITPAAEAITQATGEMYLKKEQIQLQADDEENAKLLRKFSTILQRIYDTTTKVSNITSSAVKIAEALAKLKDVIRLE